jgi:hypothetical protein
MNKKLFKLIFLTFIFSSILLFGNFSGTSEAEEITIILSLVYEDNLEGSGGVLMTHLEYGDIIYNQNRKFSNFRTRS